MKTATWRYWRRILAGNAIASLAVVFAFSDASMSTPPRDLLRAFSIAFLFASCISPLIGFSMPRFGPWAWRRFAFPLD